MDNKLIQLIAVDTMLNAQEVKKLKEEEKYYARMRSFSNLMYDNYNNQ